MKEKMVPSFVLLFKYGIFWDVLAEEIAEDLESGWVF